MKKVNELGLVVYLEKYGIDAHRVIIKGADETGYDYILEDADGRPTLRADGGLVFKLQTERKEWPDGVWANVSRLLQGEGLAVIER